MTSVKCPFDNLLILDFETTSDGKNFDYPFEVIQFSVVVLDVKENKMREDISFNQYVRPQINPILSDHCSEFTGIDQETLNRSSTFSVVYSQFLKWLANCNLVEGKFAIVSDSRQDMWRIAQYQLKLANITMPSFFRQYINLYRVFTAELERRKKPTELLANTNIGKMAEFYELEFMGRAHDANDDCRMLCKITQKALETGAFVSINEELICSAIWRKKKFETPAEWRTDFNQAMKVFERVMPLVVKVVQPKDYNPALYGQCKYCRGDSVACLRKRHRQYPAEFYSQETMPVVFADLAKYRLL